MTEQQQSVDGREGDGREVVLFHGPAAALARYGEAEVVRARALRNMALDTRANKLTPVEHFVLAQAELYYDLDHTLGEIQAWAEGEGATRKFTIMRGTSGKWRAACENALRAGTRLEEPRFFVVNDANERAELGAQDGDLVVRAEVSDYRSTQEWYQRRVQLKDEGMTSGKIDAVVGPQPVAQGWGIVSGDEIEHRNWYHNRTQVKRGKSMVWVEDLRPEARTGRKPVKFNDMELARKRARDAAVRGRWLHEGAGTRPQLEPDKPIDVGKFTIEGEWREVLGDKPKAPTGRQRQATAARAQRAQASLYGTDERSWEPDLVQAIVTMKLADNSFQAVGRLKLSPFGAVAYGQLTIEEVEPWLRIYTRIQAEAESAGHKMESHEVAALATEEWEADQPEAEEAEQ